MKDTAIKTALVSTNSITQGEQVAPLWGTLFEKYNIHIDFAHRIFRWDSEASLKAHVHCVIVGFSSCDNTCDKIIYDNGVTKKASNINSYLIDASNICIASRSKPISNVPKMLLGNKPADGGNLIISNIVSIYVSSTVLNHYCVDTTIQNYISK